MDEDAIRAAGRVVAADGDIAAGAVVARFPGCGEIRRWRGRRCVISDGLGWSRPGARLRTLAGRVRTAGILWMDENTGDGLKVCDTVDAGDIIAGQDGEDVIDGGYADGASQPRIRR
jgi:hypothetical protein